MRPSDRARHHALAAKRSIPLRGAAAQEYAARRAANRSVSRKYKNPHAAAQNATVARYGAMAENAPDRMQRKEDATD